MNRPSRGREGNFHHPVMLVEVLEALGASRGGLYVDATLGLGGHSEAILRASLTNRVIGLDRDREAIALAEAKLTEFGSRFCAIHTDYRQIKEVLGERGFGEESVDGILADLGVSSFQLDTPERGFSFRFSEEPLDMRMDRATSLTAADLVNGLNERELANLIWEFGEERAARRIARQIVAERKRIPIRTTGQLADLVVKVIHKSGRWRVHPATRTFQALRIAVNHELEGVTKFVADAIDLLVSGGRLVVITFHSLEDRILKRAFKFESGRCVCPPTQPVCSCGSRRRVELLTRKAITPSPKEVIDNPRARSAKLRACRKEQL